jgi:hypothetical protein
VASGEATAPVAVATDGNDFDGRLHVALFLPFGDNNGRHIAANGGSRRFGILS